MLITGTSAPVVLVHGLIGTFLVPDIVQHFPANRAIAPDLLGYGALKGISPGRISLSAQVAHLHEVVNRHWGHEAVHIVGHSVGGVIAMLFADSFPERVRSVVSVEGNFTLNDAFWTSSVARMGQQEVDRMLSGFRADPEAWLNESGVAAEPHAVGVARQWLSQQPGGTIRAMAESVVSVTGSPDYLDTVRAVFTRHCIHLVAGERSVAGWDIQHWAREHAASYHVIPGAGHLMMLERPAEFAAILLNCLSES